MRYLIAAALVLGTFAPPARAQLMTIVGRVVAEDTGDPVPNARVTLTGTAQDVAVHLTDADGRFTFSGSSGPHRLVVTKPGYARAELTPERLRDTEVRLQRGAVISGRVADEFGDPIIDAHVAAETVSSGPANAMTFASAATDDLGEYRLAGLPTEAFVVSVVTMSPGATPLQRAQAIDGQLAATAPPQGTPTVAIRPTVHRAYYPSVDNPAEAQQLRLTFGESRPEINFVVPATQSTGNPFSVMRVGVNPFARATERSPDATGAVRGRVVSSDGRLLSHAQVRLLPADRSRPSSVVTADEDARFEFTDLGAGAFRIIASKAGYEPIPSEPAVIGPPLLSTGRVVDLAKGEIRGRLDVMLARWGTLAGRVLDELGDPVQGARVEVLEVRYRAGRRWLVGAGATPRVTDDLGQYRLYALPPGRYIVSAVVGEAAISDVPGYARSYFPGTPTPGEAQFVSVERSQDVAGIDISLARTPTARVAGNMLDSAGEPTMGGTVRLMPSQRSTSVTAVPAGARILPDGRFEFPNVPPGQYVIHADRGRSNSWTEGEFGMLSVTVNGADVMNLTLHTRSGSSIHGRITFETHNNSKLPASSAIELSPVPVDVDLAPSSTATAAIHDDWTFDLAGLNGPRRLTALRTPPEWALKDIRVNGIDMTDRPLLFGGSNQSLSDVEVTLTDRLNTLNGAVADDRALPAPGSNVLVFSTDPARWYQSSRFLRNATADADGRFSVVGVPFGTYYAVAVGRLPADGEDAWQDPEFLTTLAPRASTVTLLEGETRTLNLRLPPR